MELEDTARRLVAPGKGILAADESLPTIEKRFTPIGVSSTADTRRQYRELLFTTPGIEEFISGVILFDETARQVSADGVPLPALLSRQGIIPGIKVDAGAKPLAGSPKEKITEGLDGLRKRLEEYRGLGMGFAKWRAVIEIDGETLPTANCLAVNAHALARYAALCQESGIVPIVEPEVLMDGHHDLARCQAVTEETLHRVFVALHRQGVRLEGMLLKPNMVVSGTHCKQQASVEEVAQSTIASLRRTVPAAVPGIVFLSGGQSDELATAHLDAMNRRGPHPWELSFSYGRALQQPALQAWRGQAANVALAKKTFHHRARCNGAARFGRYTAALEQEAPEATA